MTKDDVYRDIEHATVFDINQLEVGKIVDFTFDKATYKLEDFVVKGENPVLQEFLEVESKYTLLLPHQHIRRQSGKEVYLNIEAKDLPTIDHITDKVQRFTIMRQVDVIAADGEDLGKIIDGIFHKDNHFSLILGGSSFNRFMARFNIGTSNNLFVPYRYVKRFDPNLVQLNKNKTDLTRVINNILLDTDGLKLMEQQKLASHEARMELYNESLKDVLRNTLGNTTT